MRKPAEGAKVVYVWIALRNIGEKVQDLPQMFVEMEDVEKHSNSYGGTVCRYDDQARGTPAGSLDGASSIPALAARAGTCSRFRRPWKSKGSGSRCRLVIRPATYVKSDDGG